MTYRLPSPAQACHLSSDPHRRLGSCSRLIIPRILLGRLCLPDPPELEVLVRGTRCDRASVGTERGSEHPLVVCRNIIYLLEGGVRPEGDVVVWETVG